MLPFFSLIQICSRAQHREYAAFKKRHLHGALSRNSVDHTARRFGSGAWTRTKILGSKGPCATNCTTPEPKPKNYNELLAAALFFAAKSARRDCRSAIDLLRLNANPGEVSEWLKEHAWKACVGEILPWVQIPPSPPLLCFQWVRVLPKTLP